MTGEGGAYTISGIVRAPRKEAAQAGWTQSYPADPDYHEEIHQRAALTDNDFELTTATKSGMKFHDLDADGGRMAETDLRAGPSMWTMTMMEHWMPRTVRSDGEGGATPHRINPGTWKVKEVLQAGWTQSYPAGDTMKKSSPAEPPSQTMISGTDHCQQERDEVPRSDADGVKDGGEPDLRPSMWT